MRAASCSASAVVYRRPMSTYTVESPSNTGQTGMTWGSPPGRTLAIRHTRAAAMNCLTGSGSGSISPTPA